MGIEENKASLRLMIEEVWNKGNVAIIPEIISSDYLEPIGKGTNIAGLEGITQHVTSLRTAFPDFKMAIDDMIGEGDGIAARLTWSGTFKQKIWGIEPNNKPVMIKEAVFFYFDNGKQVKAIPFTDSLSLLQQMA